MAARAPAGASLVARQSDRPGHASPVPVVRPEPVRGGEVRALGVRQRRAGQAARGRSGRRHADHRGPRQAAQERREAADQFPAHRPRAIHLSVHPGRVRAHGERQEYDRRLADRADLRAGAAGAGRPRGAARVRRPARELFGVQESAHAAPRRRARTGRAPDRAEEPAGGRPRGIAGVPRGHRAPAERGVGGRELDPRRIRAVRALAGGNHVLRRQRPPAGPDPL